MSCIFPLIVHFAMTGAMDSSVFHVVRSLTSGDTRCKPILIQMDNLGGLYNGDGMELPRVAWEKVLDDMYRDPRQNSIKLTIAPDRLSISALGGFLMNLRQRAENSRKQTFVRIIVRE